MNKSCLECNSSKTFIYNTGKEKGKEKWYHKDNGFVCLKCYFKNRRLQFGDILLQRTKECQRKNPEIIKRSHGKRIQFKGKHRTVEYNPRKGICSCCNRSVISGEIKQTHMHHEQYDDVNPLANTKELCASCHAKESWMLGQIRNGGRRRKVVLG